MFEYRVDFPKSLRFDAVRVLPNTFINDVSVQNRTAFEAYKQVFNYDAHSYSCRIAWALYNVVAYSAVLSSVSGFTDFDFWLIKVDSILEQLSEAKQWFDVNRVYSWESALILAQLRTEQLSWIRSELAFLKLLYTKHEVIKVTSNLS